jgi:hypothetical protein
MLILPVQVPANSVRPVWIDGADWIALGAVDTFVLASGVGVGEGLSEISWIGAGRRCVKIKISAAVNKQREGIRNVAMLFRSQLRREMRAF